MSGSSNNFQAHSINSHLKHGRAWDLDKTYGGLQILPPKQGTPESGWHKGNADAIWRNRREIEAFNPELILVLSADAIYRFDYRDAIEAHLKTRAELTMVTTQLNVDEATRFGNVQTGAQNRVEKFAYKPDEPFQTNGKSEVTCEIFVYNARALLDTLDELATQNDTPREDAELSDFGDELLPAFVERGHAYAFPIGGYWRDVGTVDSYFEAHSDWLQNPPFQLDAPDWPILTRFEARSPARFGPQCIVSNSLVSPGCEINGCVENSVLGPGVFVDEDATVKDCVILAGAHIPAGVTVSRAIVEMGSGRQ
jgi:glucose-1-phosphate adenylyltransferase